MARTVTAPDGSRWSVGRRWLPERESGGAKRFGRRRPRRREGDGVDGFGDAVTYTPLFAS